jgi:hypothetical protein
MGDAGLALPALDPSAKGFVKATAEWRYWICFELRRSPLHFHCICNEPHGRTRGPWHLGKNGQKERRDAQASGHKAETGHLSDLSGRCERCRPVPAFSPVFFLFFQEPLSAFPDGCIAHS